MAATAEKTDPALWDRVKQAVTNGDHGGKPGQWSARKAQLAVQAYKKQGGGYSGRKTADNHLGQWTEEDWGTKSGRASAETHERYLPKRARERLSDQEYADHPQEAAGRRAGQAVLRPARRYRAQSRRRPPANDGAVPSDPDRLAHPGGEGRRFRPQPHAEGRSDKGPALMTSHHVTTENKKEARDAFAALVNMTPTQLCRWLDSEASRSVGMTPAGDRVTEPNQPEAVGHHMGERILAIRGKKQAALSDEDYADMRKVVGYIRRHLAQRPQGDFSDSRWRKSLMNWGHDPL